MNIVAYRLQITIAAGVDGKGLVSAAEKVAKKLALAIEPGGINAQEPFHAFYQIGIRSFNHQMKVVRHEAKTVNLPTGFLAGFLQGRKETPAVVIVAEDQFAVIPPIHHVVNCARVLDAHLPSHKRNRDKHRETCESIRKR